MESYKIEVEINEDITEYLVVPIYYDDTDNEYEVFCDEEFICLIWFEYDINGIVWCVDHQLMRQEVVDELGKYIEKTDL